MSVQEWKRCVDRDNRGPSLPDLTVRSCGCGVGLGSGFGLGFFESEEVDVTTSVTNDNRLAIKGDGTAIRRAVAGENSDELATRGEVGLQTLGEGGSVSASLGDEDAALSGKCNATNRLLCTGKAVNPSPSGAELAPAPDASQGPRADGVISGKWTAALAKSLRIS